MKTTMKRIWIFALVAILLLCAGCSNTTSGKTPSNYEQLHGLIGKPAADACAALGLDRVAVFATKEDRTDYLLPSTVEYAGITWQIELLNDWTDDTFGGFRYVARYTNNTEQAVEDALALMALQRKHRGEPTRNASSQSLANYTKEALIEKLSGAGMYETGEFWLLKDEITPELQTMIDKCEARYPDLYQHDGTYSLQLGLRYTKFLEDEAVTLFMEYKVTPQWGVVFVTERE